MGTATAKSQTRSSLLLCYHYTKAIPEGDGALLIVPCCQWFPTPGLTPPPPPACPPLSGDIIGDGSGEARGVAKLPSDTETDTGWLVRPSRGVAVGEGRAKAVGWAEQP